MRYGQIRATDVANRPGIRCSFFVTGCTHACPECFNLEYQDFKKGKIWTDEETARVINYLHPLYISGLSILGGEPFQNTEDLIKPLVEIRKGLRKNQDIWIYSGYTWEQIIRDKSKKQLLSLCDVLVDGLFIAKLKDLKLAYRGSSNQRIIRIQDSLAKNELVLWEMEE